MIDHLDLDVPPGAVTALVGSNGAGKSTLLRILLGLHSPWSGRITIGGLDPRQNRRRHGVGYVPESVTMPAGFTLRHLLTEGARLSGFRRRVADTAVQAACVRSELPADRPLSTFSKGMTRRAAFAYALLGDPRLLLLDEPFSGLDPDSRSVLRRTIAGLPARGVTTLMATHDLSEVPQLADRVLVLAAGRVAHRVGGAAPSGEELERLILERVGPR